MPNFLCQVWYAVLQCWVEIKDITRSEECRYMMRILGSCGDKGLPIRFSALYLME